MANAGGLVVHLDLSKLPARLPWVSVGCVARTRAERQSSLECSTVQTATGSGWILASASNHASARTSGGWSDVAPTKADARPRPEDTIGKAREDYLSRRAGGTSKCWVCEKRAPEGEIEACEKSGSGRPGCRR